MKQGHKGKNLVFLWKNITSMSCHIIKSNRFSSTTHPLLLHITIFCSLFALTLTCEINAMCRIYRMKSSYENRWSSRQFIIQVRVAASRALYSRAVKCTNVLHSCCGESTVQGQQMLGCPRLCPALLQILSFHRLILEGGGEKLKKTDKKTRDYRGRVNSSCSISAVAMDTNPAWIHIIEWFITVSAGIHWCFLHSRGFRVEVSSWSSGGFACSDSVLHPGRDHRFVGDYQQVWNWAWRGMQARVHAASWIGRDLQQTWQFLSPSGSRSCKRTSSRLTLPQLFIFIPTTQ